MPVVIDLFSGCGGFAFGFKSAGYKIGNGIEIDDIACRTASYNLYWRYGDDQQHICGDITKLNPEKSQQWIGKNGCIVIGGPPCQAYSQVGKGKLKSLGKDRSHLNDARGYLFKDFIRFALELDARVIIMENVPESVNYGGLNIPEHVCEVLEENDYNSLWTILNAADFGVPQVRERVFVMAVRKNEKFDQFLPAPTHKKIDGRLTPWQTRFSKLSEYRHFTYPGQNNVEALPEWITVGEAISDLPPLFPDSKHRYRLYQPHIQLEYKTMAQNDYQLLMRNWFSSEQKASSGHCFRRTARDFPIFERMLPDHDYLDAYEIAENILDEACRALSIDSSKHNYEYERLRKSIVPPYSKEKFNEKWKRLSKGKPSHTLVAHLGVDTYSHIHPWEPRGISVREAARLQSFPDGFLFQCSMGEAYKQIGNAVPPLLAKSIALSLKEKFHKEQGCSDGNIK